MFFPRRRSLEDPSAPSPGEAPPRQAPFTGGPQGPSPEVRIPLEGALRGREEAHLLLEPLLPQDALTSPLETVVLDLTKVTSMGRRFVLGVMEVLFYEGRTTHLSLQEPPPHALLYFREEAYHHGLSGALTVVPRSPRFTS